MSKVDPVVEQAVDTLGLNRVTRRRLLSGVGLTSASLAASALLAACTNNDDKSTDRLAYIGQGLYESGFALGQRAIEAGLDSGEVVGFIATPGALNIQPRIDGASDAIKQSGKSLKFTAVGTNADVTRGLSIIDAYAQGHPDLAGMLAVDAGSTQAVGQVVQKYSMRDKSLKVAGGFDLVPETLNAINGGSLDFTIDQQPYLQGFLPVLYLYLYKLSGGVVLPSETNTGLVFLDSDSAKLFLDTSSRFEG